MTAHTISKKTQVLILGGGPAGMLLGHVLNRHGIDNIVLERRTREYVLSRVRGGGLEPGTVKFLLDEGLLNRLSTLSRPHDYVSISCAEPEIIHLEMKKYTGKSMILYGQKYVTEDLYAARDAAGGENIHNVTDVKLHDMESEHPYVTFSQDQQNFRIDCDYIAGCDGARGVSWQSIPASKIKIYEKSYPFGWFGIVSETPPYPEPMYGYHERGFALLANRGPMLARNFIQCNINEKIEDWPDERYWTELKARFPKVISDKIIPGPIMEKTIAPLRSRVIEPMQYGRLFLAGDAAHLVPPTAAKGLNLAVSDIYYLSQLMVEAYKTGNARCLDRYSETALKRVWGAERFSWWMTNLFHTFPDASPFDRMTHNNEFHYLATSEHAQASLAEQYIGLPL